MCACGFFVFCLFFLDLRRVYGFLRSLDPVSSNNKTDSHDITEIKHHNPKPYVFVFASLNLSALGTGPWLLWASGDGGCQVIMRIALLWGILGNILGECHAHCKLNTSYVDFVKE